MSEGRPYALHFGGARGALRIVATLEEFLLRGIPFTEELLALEAGTPAFAAKHAEIATLNDDFEEATTPGSNPEWFAMSSLMQLVIAFGTDPTDARRLLVTEALEKAKQRVYREK